jgi:hypothetical protein
MIFLAQVMIWPYNPDLRSASSDRDDDKPISCSSTGHHPSAEFACADDCGPKTIPERLSRAFQKLVKDPLPKRNNNDA